MGNLEHIFDTESFNVFLKQDQFYKTFDKTAKIEV